VQALYKSRSYSGAKPNKLCQHYLVIPSRSGALCTINSCLLKRWPLLSIMSRLSHSNVMFVTHHLLQQSCTWMCVCIGHQDTSAYCTALASALAPLTPSMWYNSMTVTVGAGSLLQAAHPTKAPKTPGRFLCIAGNAAASGYI
jgi:hypothetical protein